MQLPPSVLCSHPLFLAPTRALLKSTLGQHKSFVSFFSISSFRPTRCADITDSSGLCKSKTPEVHEVANKSKG